MVHRSIGQFRCGDQLTDKEREPLSWRPFSKGLALRITVWPNYTHSIISQMFTRIVILLRAKWPHVLKGSDGQWPSFSLSDLTWSVSLWWWMHMVVARGRPHSIIYLQSVCRGENAAGNVVQSMPHWPLPNLAFSERGYSMGWLEVLIVQRGWWTRWRHGNLLTLLLT